MTRPEQQAGGMCRLIEQCGGTAIRFPVIQILPIAGSEVVKTTLARLETFDWVIFISRNAVHFALQANNGKIPSMTRGRLVAIGQATAEAMREAGLRVDLQPEKNYNSEALLTLPQMQQIAGQSCLIIRGQGGRELLGDILRLRGATVDYLEVYKRERPTGNAQLVIEKITNDSLDVITMTSGEGLQNLVDLLGNDIKSKLLVIPLVVASERIKKLAETLGFCRVSVAAKASDAEIINTVIALINGEKSG